MRGLSSAKRTGFALLLFGCAACDESKNNAPPPSRVEAIAAKADDKPTDLCDVVPTAGNAPTFVWPELAGASPPSVTGYRWLNVWATWCPPCIEELPLLRKLQAELNSGGTPVVLTLLSVDGEADAVSKFERDHPEVTGSLRIADVLKLEPWLTAIGLDKGATLPVHVFVDPKGKVLCSRTGALSEADAPRLRRLLRAP